MTDWTRDAPSLAPIDPVARRKLAGLVPVTIPRGYVMFQPGDAARGFVFVLSGRIDVFLVGPSGRDILLYPVAPGDCCIQSTLGLLGGAAYSAEAVAATDCRAVLVPREMFLDLMDSSPAFRTGVFAAFAGRMQDIMHLVERVTFQRIDSRLAGALLALDGGGTVAATHADLASRIGSAREVVSRRLEAMARAGLVATERGAVRLTDPTGLRRLAAEDGLGDEVTDRA
jgi:CRP/FNR family transcriptional regulator